MPNQEMITHVFMVEPVAKARARFGNGRTYTPAKTVKFENEIRVNAQRKRVLPLMGPLTVNVRFYLSKPKSSKNKYPTPRPDLDNYLKSLFDALNEVFWADDSQIVGIYASKEYCNKAGEQRIEIIVRGIE